MRPSEVGSARRLCVLLALATAGWLAACAGKPGLRDGEAMVARGELDAGLAVFERLHDETPRNPEIRAAWLRTRERLLALRLAEADQLLARAQADPAELAYRRALALDPSNPRALDGLRGSDRLRRHAGWLAEARSALAAGDSASAQQKLLALVSENPANEEALALLDAIAVREAADTPPPRLSAAMRKPITLEFRDGTLRQIFDVIARVSGLNFVFDREVRSDQKATIHLKNSSIEAAVHYLLLTNQLEQRVLDADTVLVYPATAAKQKEYQQTVIRSFHLANAEAKTVAATLKTVLKSRDIVADDKLNLVIVRDSPEAIQVAEKLVALQDAPEPEVMLEVEILEVKRQRLAELGVRWPDSLSLAPLPAGTGATLTLRDLQQLGPERTGVTLSPLAVRARDEAGSTNILANPRIRARNREKAKILIGERVPNITTTSTATGFVAESVSYVDVGLKLEVEPQVHLDNEVAIKIALEVSNIVSQVQTKAGSVTYQIGTRTASTVLRLKDGENQILAGLINDEDRQTAQGVPLLGQLPLLGRLFGSRSDNRQKTEIVLSITPRLVRNLQRPGASLLAFAGGTENSFRPWPRNLAPDLPPTATAGAGVTAIAPRLVWRAPTTVKPGELFSADLVLQEGPPLPALPLVISHDPQVAEVAQLVAGDVLGDAGKPDAHGLLASRIDPAGKVLLTARPVDGGGFAGAGVLFTVKLRALAEGMLKLRLGQEGAANDGSKRPALGPLPALFVRVAQ